MCGHAVIEILIDVRVFKKTADQCSGRWISLHWTTVSTLTSGCSISISFFTVHVAIAISRSDFPSFSPIDAQNLLHPVSF